jgi:hypothetical protein
MKKIRISGLIFYISTLVENIAFNYIAIKDKEIHCR